jgi:6-phosphogluconolactonase
VTIEIDRRGSAEDVAAAAARLLEAHLRRGAHIALSGGSTPRRAYALAADGQGDWSGVTLWLGDERLVFAGDERSNGRMVHEQLVDRLPSARRPVLEVVRTELGLEGAATDYEQRLRAALGEDGRLDLALMGLGPDSHTASLFPEKPALGERERWIAPVPEAGMEPLVPRVTMTLPLFNAAREVVFLVAGEDKAEAMVRAFGEPPDPASPAARVRPSGGRLVLLCDESAATGLKTQHPG